MNAEIELELAGEARKHPVRLELDFELGRAAPAIGRNYDATKTDAGDPGGVSILRAFVQRVRKDKAIAEKRVPSFVLKRLREDDHLERWLYGRMMEGFPNA